MFRFSHYRESSHDRERLLAATRTSIVVANCFCPRRHLAA